MDIPLLSIVEEVPAEPIALKGKFVPAAVMVHLVMVFPSFPVVVPVEKPMVASVADVLEPATVQFFIVLFVASAKKTIVEAPVALVLVFEMVKALLLVFKPSIVTLSAPFKTTSGKGKAPVIVLSAPPLGEIVNEVHVPTVG